MENLDAVDTQVLRGVVNALKSSPSSNKAVILKFIGNTLRSRFERSGSIHDLDLAIEATEEGLRSLPDNHPDRPSFLNNTGVALLQRYQHNGSLDDLETSIRMKQMTVNTIADDHPDRPLYLGNALQKLSQRTGKEDDLEAAIRAHETAVDLTPHNDVRGIRLNNLSAALIELFERTRLIEDLNRAIEACNAGIKMTAPDDLRIGTYLTNLGIALRYRLEMTGSIADLDSAIRTCARALRSATTASIDRPRRLNNLGLALRIRFERTGSLNDIRAAICAADPTGELITPIHVAKPLVAPNWHSMRSFQPLAVACPQLNNIDFTTEAYPELLSLQLGRLNLQYFCQSTPNSSGEIAVWIDSVYQPIQKYKALRHLNDSAPCLDMCTLFRPVGDPFGVDSTNDCYYYYKVALSINLDLVRRHASRRYDPYYYQTNPNRCGKSCRLLIDGTPFCETRSRDRC